MECKTAVVNILNTLMDQYVDDGLETRVACMRGRGYRW